MRKSRVIGRMFASVLVCARKFVDDCESSRLMMDYRCERHAECMHQSNYIQTHTD